MTRNRNPANQTSTATAVTEYRIKCATWASIADSIIPRSVPILKARYRPLTIVPRSAFGRQEAYNESMNDDGPPLLCTRCATELTPGKGNFYVVRIEALADPSPPRFSDEDLEHDHRAEIERLIVQMRDLSERELVDQVYRQLLLYLCSPCYRRWIEDPVK